IERSAWRALVEAVCPTAKTIEGVILYLSYCKARRLDPMKRPVHIVPIWDKDKRRYVETVWPGIGELRTTAMRTKLYGGCDECRFGPDQTTEFSGTVGGDGKERRVNATVVFPQWAQVTVYRMVEGQRVSVPGPRVYWTETYARQGRSDVPNDMWQKRPRGQLEKCAEAAALRRAFPEEIGNDVTVDEAPSAMEHAPVIDQDGVLERPEVAPEEAPTQSTPAPERRGPGRPRKPPQEAAPQQNETPTTPEDVASDEEMPVDLTPSVEVSMPDGAVPPQESDLF
ncbi:MAG: phage recombination protein Bet, partial [Bradyrhizobium sp.]